MEGGGAGVLGGDYHHRSGASYVQQQTDNGYLVERERRRISFLKGKVGRTRFDHWDRDHAR